MRTLNCWLAAVRTVPHLAGAHDVLLLRRYDEFAFAEDFLAVLKDTTGIFEVTDDKPGATESFSRINNLRESYEAAVLVVTDTTAEGKARKTLGLKVEYWDYWRVVDIGGDKTAREFLLAEMNSETGWFELWRGREFFSG
ncbi:MAG: hypothetical protein ABI651_13425 [Verrucomicrobiota bacterium]